MELEVEQQGCRPNHQKYWVFRHLKPVTISRLSNVWWFLRVARVVDTALSASVGASRCFARETGLWITARVFLVGRLIPQIRI